MKPSYEQLETELAQTKTELAQTKELLKLALFEISSLKKEVADLKEKLNLNSKNSSKPPSTDQKGNTPNRERKKRHSRKGVARAPYPPEKVDEKVDCTQDNCPHCGSGSIEKVGTPEKLQQAE